MLYFMSTPLYKIGYYAVWTYLLLIYITIFTYLILGVSHLVCRRMADIRAIGRMTQLAAVSGQGQWPHLMLHFCADLLLYTEKKVLPFNWFIPLLLGPNNSFFGEQRGLPFSDVNTTEQGVFLGRNLRILFTFISHSFGVFECYYNLPQSITSESIYDVYLWQKRDIHNFFSLFDSIIKHYMKCV